VSGTDTTTGQIHYAGFWTRAAARIIDLVLILATFSVVHLADRLGADAGMWTGSGLGEGGPAGSGFSMANVLRGLFFLAFPVFYYVYLHGTYGQTFGKMAMKIRVVNEDGSPIDHRKAFLRWLGYFLCDLTFNLGYLWAAFDPRKQGLHDKVCRTVVIRTDVPVPEHRGETAVEAKPPVPADSQGSTPSAPPAGGPWPPASSPPGA
jgi:uncharacterized RDD family membrane protein YckC